MGHEVFLFKRSRKAEGHITIGPIPYHDIESLRKFALLKWVGLEVTIVGGWQYRFYFRKHYNDAYSCFVSRCIECR
ncbi:hypothetical protein EV182_006993 [Spiromyces aspiralis]|uniref:Uncharacterized protein n=1 Tax=Spiromyces aspiralis TaxID=68401 RepID=A0ACC1H8H4_9FUNG|nr:hypothetical protein EV182_006993 [Spiromyces aspiralis]